MKPQTLKRWLIVTAVVYLRWAAEADLLRRQEAARAYRRALGLVRTGPERRYLERRLAEVGG